MGGGFSVNDERVLPEPGASGLLVLGTRLAIFLPVVLAVVALFRMTFHRGFLVLVVCVAAGIICTAYCSGRILEHLWLFSGRVSARIWKAQTITPANLPGLVKLDEPMTPQELTYG